jgi:hypothetical protein
MTPKEKAQELIDKFIQLENGELYIRTAKQCAIIAVDEMIKLLVDLSGDSFIYIKEVMYYQEVKQEIK